MVWLVHLLIGELIPIGPKDGGFDMRSQEMWALLDGQGTTFLMRSLSKR